MISKVLTKMKKKKKYIGDFSFQIYILLFLLSFYINTSSAKSLGENVLYFLWKVLLEQIEIAAPLLRLSVLMTILSEPLTLVKLLSNVIKRLYFF